MTARDHDGGGARVPSIDASLALACANGLGECPLWDVPNQRLLWVDHARHTIHGAIDDGSGGWREEAGWAPGGPVGSLAPRAAGGFVLVGGDAVTLVRCDGTMRPFARIDVDPATVRFSDARCDSRGRLWAGVFASDFTPRGGLYRVDPDGRVCKVLKGVTIANGLDWSPDGTIFYFVDSVECRVDAYAFDAEQGRIANRRTLIALPPGRGIPNGLTVDDEGCVWIALTGAGEIIRVRADGKLVGRVRVPVAGVTSCAFGGADRRTLFITTRSGRLPEAVRSLGMKESMMENKGPLAGALFRAAVGARGKPEGRFGA